MWKSGVPEVDGRYFILVDFKGPVMSAELGKIWRERLPMVSNYTVKRGWFCNLPEMTVTHWMEVPKVEEASLMERLSSDGPVELTDEEVDEGSDERRLAYLNVRNLSMDSFLRVMRRLVINLYDREK